MSLVLALRHCVRSEQINREKGEKFHVVGEKAGELFKESSRQHRSFKTNGGKAPREGKEGSKLKHLLQMPHSGRERPPWLIQVLVQ